MPFEAGAITGKITLDHTGASIAMEKIEKDSASMRDAVEMHSREAGASMKQEMGGAFDGLKEKFGRESDLGELMHTLSGAGALFAFGEGSSMLKEMTGSLAELKGELDSGKISADEFDMKLAEGIPIIGSLVSTGENIGEMLSGAKQEAEEFNEEMKRSEEMWKLEREGIQEAADAMESLREGTERYLTEIKNIGANPHTALINSINESEQTRQLRQSYNDKISVARTGEEKLALERQEKAGDGGILRQAQMHLRDLQGENSEVQYHAAEQQIRRFDFDKVAPRTNFASPESQKQQQALDVAKAQLDALEKIITNTGKTPATNAWIPVTSP